MGHLLQRGYRHPVLFIENEDNIFEKKRIRGFIKELQNHGLSADENDVTECAAGEAVIAEKVKALSEKHPKADSIICTNNIVAYHVLRELRKNRIAVPEQIQVVSFYDSSILANRIPAVTSIRFDVEELGRKACELLLRILDGEEAERRTLLGYEVCMRASTK